MNNLTQTRVYNLFQFLKYYQGLRSPIMSNIENEEWLMWLDDTQITPNLGQKGILLQIDQKHSLFDSFYTIYDKLKREYESIELLLGDGILYHTHDDGLIHYPTLLQPVTVLFQPEIPLFTLCTTNRMPYLQKDILQRGASTDQTFLQQLYKSYDKVPFSPMLLATHPELLNQIGYSYDPHITIQSSSHDLDKQQKGPVLYRRPVLFMHKKRYDAAIAIDDLLQDVHKRNDVPLIIRSILGLGESERSIEHNEIIPFAEEELKRRVHLSKPANIEQRLAAYYLQNNDAVLIQGAPGTGKTHTIANIIGDLLAQGKKILVTSVSEKALSIVLRHIPTSLHTFCMDLCPAGENGELIQKSLEDLHRLRSKIEAINLSETIELLEVKYNELLNKSIEIKSVADALQFNSKQLYTVAGQTWELSGLIEWILKNEITIELLDQIKIDLSKIIERPQPCTVAEIECFKVGIIGGKSYKQWTKLLNLINRTYVLYAKKGHSTHSFLEYYSHIRHYQKVIQLEWERIVTPLGVPKIQEMAKPYPLHCIKYGKGFAYWLTWYRKNLEQTYNRLKHLKLIDWEIADISPDSLWRTYVPDTINELEHLTHILIHYEEWKENQSCYQNLIMELARLEEEMESISEEIIFYKAWKHRLEDFKLNPMQVQAIEGWKQLVQKIGNGKNKNTAILRKEAKRLVPICQNAIPVWVMPLHKVLSYFTPSQNQFDVVIIDEASQMDISGLIALYLGKKVLIVGDDQQVTPLAIGEKQDALNDLIQAYLYDIPNAHLYSGKFSLYDLALLSGQQPLELREHFRSVPEIIGFANTTCYHNEVLPLRSGYPNEVGFPLRTVQVSGASEVDGVNEQEADIIVNLVEECLHQQQYMNKSFGILSLKSEKQALLIESKLHQRISALEYEKHQILCGTSVHFQGDERDILFISCVDTPDSKGTIRLITQGADQLYKKRYNVAMSRGKDQIWLVHSFDPHKHLKTGDLRKSLFDYIQQLTGNEKNPTYELSEEILYIYNLLVDKGYCLKKAQQIGNYAVPIMVVGRETQVGLTFEKHTIEKEVQLKRLGWQLIYIPLPLFSVNPEEQMDLLIHRLRAYDVYPTAMNENCM